MKHNEPFEDDGRTVADMSGIEHDSIWLPRRRKQGHTPAQQPQQAADPVSYTHLTLPTKA